MHRRDCVLNLDNLVAGGVRTLIALHHGRKTKNESFTSCRGRGLVAAR